MALASDYTSSEDKKSYTFFLKKHIYWSNGDPITPLDFLSSWEYAKKHSPLSYLFQGMNFSSSSSSITITLDSPNPDLPKLLSTPLFSVFKPQDLTLSSGPFYLSKYLPRRFLTVKSNNHYYDKDKVKLSSIRLLIVPDLHTSSLLLNQKKIHWLGQPWHQGLTKEIKDLSPFHYTHYPVQGTFWLILNTNHPALSKKAYRQLLAQTIDREEIIHFALQGSQTPASFITFKEPITTPTAEQKLTLTYPANILRCQRIAEILQQQLHKTNIDLSLEALDYHVFLHKRYSKDYMIITQTEVAYYPYQILLSEGNESIKNIEMIPIYHMNYDYLTTSPLQKVIHNASGAVDLKYACLS